MRNIESGLLPLFKFKGDENALMAESIATMRSQSIPASNIRVTHPEWNWYGMVDTVINGRKGPMLYHYSALRELSKEGEQLPGRLSSYKDCSYNFYGALLNILAYFSGERFETLTLMANGSGTKQYNFRIREDLAILFLSNMVEEKSDEARQVPAVSSKKLELF